MNVTTKSSSGEYYFKAFTKSDYWVVERRFPGFFGDTFEYLGTAYSRQGVLDLCVNRTRGNNARVVAVS
jgi:ABC-type transport system substrate-binding protein